MSPISLIREVIMYYKYLPDNFELSDALTGKWNLVDKKKNALNYKDIILLYMKNDIFIQHLKEEHLIDDNIQEQYSKQSIELLKAELRWYIRSILEESLDLSYIDDFTFNESIEEEIDKISKKLLKIT